MTKVFPAWRLGIIERRYDPATGQMTEWTDTGSYFEVEEATHDYIIEKTGQRPPFLMSLTRDPGAWAAVFFTRTIERSDEVLRVRDELGAQIAFAAYDETELGMSNPPLGAMVVNRPADLAAASSRHEVFRTAWDALKSFAHDKQWVAVVDL
jgi:hypothetical protein